MRYWRLSWLNRVGSSWDLGAAAKSQTAFPHQGELFFSPLDTEVINTAPLIFSVLPHEHFCVCFWKATFVLNDPTHKTTSDVWGNGASIWHKSKCYGSGKRSRLKEYLDLKVTLEWLWSSRNINKETKATWLLPKHRPALLRHMEVLKRLSHLCHWSHNC